MTEAERKAKNNYRGKGKRLTVDFYPSEADLIRHIESQENKQGYIKALIRGDIEPPKPCSLCEDLDELYEVVCYIPNDNGGATDIEICHCPRCGRKINGGV